MNRPVLLPVFAPKAFISLRSITYLLALSAAWINCPAHAQDQVLSSSAAVLSQQPQLSDSFITSYKNQLDDTLSGKNGKFYLSSRGNGQKITGYDLLEKTVSIDGELYSPYGDLEEDGTISSRSDGSLGTAFETPGLVLVDGSPYVKESILNEILWKHYGLEVVGTYLMLLNMYVPSGAESIVAFPLTSSAGNYQVAALKEAYTQKIAAPTRDAWLNRLQAGILVDGVPMVPLESLDSIFTDDAALTVQGDTVIQRGRVISKLFGSDRATAGVRDGAVVYLPVTLVPGVTVDLKRGLLIIPHSDTVRVTLQIDTLALPKLNASELMKVDAQARQQAQSHAQQQAQAAAQEQVKQDAATKVAATAAQVQANALARQKAQQQAQQAAAAAAAKAKADALARQQAVKNANLATQAAAQAKKDAAAQRIAAAAQAKLDAATQAASQKQLAIAQKLVPGVDLFQIGSKTYAGYKFTDHKIFLKIVRITNNKVVDSCSSQTLDSVIVVQANVARTTEDSVIMGVRMLDGSAGYLGFTLRSKTSICVGSVLR